MYRRPKFLETLLEIRREMAREADYDVDLFAEMARSGRQPPQRSDASEPEDADIVPPTGKVDGAVQPISPR